MNVEAIQSTVKMCRENILQMLKVQYPNLEGKNSEYVIFIKMVLCNLMGRLTMELTNHAIEGAFEKNIKSTLCELQEWFDMALKDMKDIKDKIKKEVH